MDDPGLPASSAYPLRVRTGSADNHGLLILVDGELVAVLVELSDDGHEHHQGSWHVEAVFGLDTGRVHDTFPTAQEAADWVCEKAGGVPCQIHPGLAFRPISDLGEFADPRRV